MQTIMETTIDFTSKESRWEAVLQRNPRADGAFVYAVQTTGIFCRPACASRLPKRENVRFFDTWQAAEEAGFRPCKRCRPQTAKTQSDVLEIVTKACRMIEEADKEPTLKQLADGAGLSPYHFHRLFKKTVGITPKQYAKQHRLGQVRSRLRGDSTVTNAIYQAGYGSSSRFYENAEASLGMKPSEYQQGGEGMLIHYAIVQSYLGWVLVAYTERGICRIDFDDRRKILETRLENIFPKAKLQSDDPSSTAVIAQTLAFLEAPETGLGLPLDVQGTAFQQRVWQALQNIRAGETASYGEIAAQIGSPKSARAVAQACASNPVAVAIPCHRVVKRNGELGGYRWGIERKQTLLAREAHRSNESSR
jgi:AraC family transcriptional regulator of adaptative response/methylated-DNA-[protein]-cysteine methyltransferase